MSCWHFPCHTPDISIKSLLYLVTYIVFQTITDKNFSYHVLTVKAFEQYKLCYSNNNNNNNQHISFMELGHLLTRSGLTYPEVSSKVYHDSFCKLWSSISLPWIIYFETFYLHVVSSFSCIPVICPKWALFLTPLQFVHLFWNLSKCILLFFSRISSLLLLFFWHHLI